MLPGGRPLLNPPGPPREGRHCRRPSPSAVEAKQTDKFAVYVGFSLLVRKCRALDMCGN